MARARFCSACGSELPHAPPVTCASCGTSHWRNPVPCANGIVLDEGRVLLTRRALSPWRGMWCAPGGFCERGEHPAETVVREALEEAGVHVTIADYLGTWVDVYADDAEDSDAEVINVAYYTASVLGETRTSVDTAEVSEAGWFALDDLPDGLAPPGTLEAVLAAVRSPGRSRPR